MEKYGYVNACAYGSPLPRIPCAKTHKVLNIKTFTQCLGSWCCQLPRQFIT